MARFANFGFQIAPETKLLMSEIASSGELDSLTPERVWRETENALQSPTAQVYFDVLQEVGALSHLFPKLVYHAQVLSNDWDKHARWSLITAATPSKDLSELNAHLRTPNQFCWFSEQSRSFIEAYQLPLAATVWEPWLTSVAAIKKPHSWSR